ncbi:MAG TPA: DMT family transporter [Acidimicrobiia bacterium]|nr:DMT family transporter [Acidimicrobiia bacterium]
MNNRRGIAGLTLAYVSWSLCNTLTAQARFGAGSLLFVAVLLAIVLHVYCKKRKIELTFEESKKLLPYAAMRAISLSLLCISMLYIKVGIVDTIISCNVFFTIGVLAPLNGEKVRRAVFIPLIFAIGGIALITGVFNQQNNLFDFHIVLPFITMFCLGISVVMWRRSTQHVSPVKNLTYMHTYTALFTLPIVGALILFTDTQKSFIPNFHQLLPLLLCAIASLVGDKIYTTVQKHTTITLNSLFGPTGAVFSCFFGWTLNHDVLTTTQITGIVLVVASVLVANYIHATAPQREQEVMEPLAPFANDIPRAYEVVPPRSKLEVA